MVHLKSISPSAQGPHYWWVCSRRLWHWWEANGVVLEVILGSTADSYLVFISLREESIHHGSSSSPIELKKLMKMILQTREKIFVHFPDTINEQVKKIRK